MEADPTQPVTAETQARPSVPADPNIRVSSAEPRIFGVVPPALALLVGAAAAICGIVLIPSGSAPAGLLILAGGILLATLAIDAARRWPTSALPRISVRVADAVGSRLGLARVSTATWGAAAREMVAMKRELRALRGEREERQSALGAAAYRDDAGEMESLRARLTEVDERIAACEQAIEDAVARARERMRKERSAVRPTESFAVAEEPEQRADGTAHTSPTMPRESRPDFDTPSTDS